MGNNSQHKHSASRKTFKIHYKNKMTMTCSSQQSYNKIYTGSRSCRHFTNTHTQFLSFTK